MAHARTTAVRPANPALTGAIRLALGFALVKLALHIATNLWEAHIGWGYFRDEFYYIACGRHLAWGYVDHGPIVALQARLAETLFGHSLAGLRLPAALAGATRVALTGLLAYTLGGRRSAQSLAMLGVLVAPQYLGIDSFLSMNSFESPLWMTCLLALLVLERRVGATSTTDVPSLSPSALDPRPLTRSSPASAGRALTPWLLFGLAAGLGLLNKPSMTFFLVALGIALLATHAGRLLLLRREALAGIALMVVIASPNLFWQVHHRWPTLEFLHNGRAEGKNLALAPLAFLNQQIQTLHPFNVFLWLSGLVWLLRRERWRWLGLTYLFFLAIMMALHAKDYYVTPAYPILFAAGGIAWEQRRWRPFGSLSAAPDERRAHRILAFPLYQATLVVTGLLVLPMAIPVFTPETWLRYTHALHLYDEKTFNTEKSSSGVLPQFYADRFGWQEYLEIVSRTYAALSPEDRARVLLFAKDYGEAGALDVLSGWEHVDLPPAASGQNNYWLWGTHGRDPNLVIAIISDTPEDVARKYISVTLVGRIRQPLAMPFEQRRNVYLLRGRRASAPFDWRDERFFY